MDHFKFLVFYHIVSVFCFDFWPGDVWDLIPQLGI